MLVIAGLTRNLLIVNRLNNEIPRQARNDVLLLASSVEASQLINQLIIIFAAL